MHCFTLLLPSVGLYKLDWAPICLEKSVTLSRLTSTKSAWKDTLEAVKFYKNSVFVDMKGINKRLILINWDNYKDSLLNFIFYR